VGRGGRTGAGSLAARLVRAAGVVARAAMKRVVLGHADSVAHAAVVGAPIAIVVDAVAAHFLVGEFAAAAYLELGVARLDARPIVRLRTVAISPTQFRAEAASRIDPHAEAGRAVLGLLAAIAELPRALRGRIGDRAAVGGRARTEEDH